ncbi:protein Red [Nephila pilipes]|uniref:Protein Red n=1 Tax=Nephila pilipes TaxID=299642 RepID=A0A8X6JJA6_NEPPI|nr:protein Red [Nephila pilipes]
MLVYGHESFLFEDLLIADEEETEDPSVSIEALMELLIVSGNENVTQRYRNRAKEREDGLNSDYQNEDPIASAICYRAIALDAKSGLNNAEQRRQMIQEFKFLCRGMEHTHLVKGLDYALL